MVGIAQAAYLTLLHSERSKLHTILAFLSAVGLRMHTWAQLLKANVCLTKSLIRVRLSLIVHIKLSVFVLLLKKNGIAFCTYYT